MFSVLVIRLRSLRVLRVSGIGMRLRMCLRLSTFLKASHSFRNRLLVICKNAYLFATMSMTSRSSPCSWCSVFFFSSRRRHMRFDCDWSSDVCSSDLQRSLWYPINLLSAVAMPALAHATLAELRAFNLSALVIGTMVHGLISVLVGLLYAVILPMLPRRHMLWGGVIAPLLWTGLVWALLGVVDPTLGARDRKS